MIWLFAIFFHAFAPAHAPGPVSGYGKLPQFMIMRHPAAVTPEWSPAGPMAQVHSSCEGLLAVAVPGFVRDVFANGVACLEGLQRTHSRDSRGARDNLQALRRLTTRGPISVMCHEDDPEEWKSGIAHASVRENQVAMGVRFPYVSFRPNGNFQGYDTRQILFHEALHTLGHRHGVSVEYPYACGDCCFPEGAVNPAACQLCRRSYRGIDDLRYLDDLTEWGWNSRIDAVREHAQRTLRDALEKGKNQRHILYLMLSFGGPGELVNSLLGEEFERRYAPVRDREVMVGMVKGLSRYPDHAPLLTPARQYVRLFGILSIDRDREAAIAYLASLPDGAFPAEWPGATPSVKGLYDDLRERMKGDIWKLSQSYDPGDRAKAIQIWQNLRRLGL